MSEKTITGLAIQGFKSISSEQHIEIRPLTILAGANSSGKSSIMQPLLLLKQTLEASVDPGALLLDGPNVRFTSVEQMLSHSVEKAKTSGFHVRLEATGNRFLELQFQYAQGKGCDLSKMILNEGKQKLAITRDMKSEDIKKFFSSTRSKGLANVFPFKVKRERCFFNFDTDFLSFPPQMFLPNMEIFFNFITDKIIHLPGLRGNPERNYPHYAAGPSFPGTFEQYTASVIHRWQSEGGKEIPALEAALKDMGLTWKIEAKRIEDTQIEIRVGRLPKSAKNGSKDLVSIADVGLGVSQSLPVIVALLVAKPGQMVYLEQPEIHLHPLAQRKLIGILAQAAKRGVIVVVETHSSILLKELQTMVAKDHLDKDLVKLHWFQRDKNGDTTVSSADLDEMGAFGSWPEDFDNIELDVEKDYLDAVEKKAFA